MGDQATKVTNKGVVQQKVSELGNSVWDMKNMLGKLEDLMAPVLTPSLNPPSPRDPSAKPREAAGDTPRVPPVSLRSQINEIIDMAENNKNKIEELQDRLEI